MKKSIQVLSVVLSAAFLIVSLGRCGEGDSGPDAGSRKDGGPPPVALDASSSGADTGPAGGPDASLPAHETTIPEMNNQAAPGHAAFASYPDNRVHFKGVAMSPVFQDYKSTSNADPAKWYCRKGIYLADPTAPADHNGILVLSEGTVPVKTGGDGGTYGGPCNADSPLDLVGTIALGDELEVTGFFTEDCWRTNLTGPCDVKDQNGKGISRVVVKVNVPAGIVKTGQNIQPTTLPAQVAIEDIASGALSGSGTAATVTLPANWWKYRQVLVKIPNVTVTNGSGPSCNWTIQAQGNTSGPTLNVQDDIYFTDTKCTGRPAQGASFSSVTGFSTWYTSGGTSPKAETQLAPRSLTELVP